MTIKTIALSILIDYAQIIGGLFLLTILTIVFCTVMDLIWEMSIK